MRAVALSNEDWEILQLRESGLSLAEIREMVDRGETRFYGRYFDSYGQPVENESRGRKAFKSSHISRRERDARSRIRAAAGRDLTGDALRAFVEWSDDCFEVVHSRLVDGVGPDDPDVPVFPPVPESCR